MDSDAALVGTFAPVEKLLASRHHTRSLMEMMAEAQLRLQNMEISCKQMLISEGNGNVTPSAPAANGSSSQSSHSPVEILQLQVEQLKTRLLEAVSRREQEDHMFKQAMVYASAKSTANAVLHTLFDQAKAGKHSVLAEWLETGVIPTRDGLKHWRVDLRDIRNEEGSTLLHAAVGRTMAREEIKVKLTVFLLDTVGFDPNVRDLVRFEGDESWFCWSMAVLTGVYDGSMDSLDERRCTLQP